MLSANPKHVMTVEDRSHFADLKVGAMVPGYRGYVPNLKFHQGSTYGVGTEEMYTMRLKSEGRALPTHTTYECLPEISRTRTLPPADGVNKLTEEMKPGYTGYVPRRPFIFGGTYRAECEECVDEFLGSRETNSNYKTHLESTVASYPKLHPITKQSLVVKKLNHLRDYKDGAPAIAEDKRTGTEAPIPGYAGFVPRTAVTDLGLGARYHITSEKGYRGFFADSLKHASNLGEPLQSKTMQIEPCDTAGEMGTGPSGNMDRRLYNQTGMLPKYTGYIPHQPYAFGKTYGNMTRSLSACAHEYPTYGTYKTDERRALATSARA
jgi:hypothetical protein